MPELIAALDGGGTKTELVWADAMGNLGRIRIAVGCSPQDSPDWLTPLRQVLAALPNAPKRIVFGIPSFGEVPALDRTVTAEIAYLCPNAATILNDVALAYQGAFPDGGGVLVLAGTGSMAIAEGPKGLRRTGGWGDAYGDEGSAHWIGREALSVVSQMLDGRLPSTGFDLGLCDRVGVAARDGGFALMAWVQSSPNHRPRVASIAAHVDALAKGHDATAQGILHTAAAHLERHASAAAALAGLGAIWPWASAGSVFRSRFLCQSLSALIGHPASPPRHCALIGGLILAARSALWPTSPDWTIRISANLAATIAEQDPP